VLASGTNVSTSSDERAGAAAAIPEGEEGNGEGAPTALAVAPVAPPPAAAACTTRTLVACPGLSRIVCTVALTAAESRPMSPHPSMSVKTSPARSPAL
jgi:hypothetical protein